MNKFKYVPSMLLVLFLAGCSGVRVDVQKYVGCQPQLNVESEAHIGDVVFSQWNMQYEEFPSIEKNTEYRRKSGEKIPVGALSYVTGNPPFATIGAGDRLYCANRAGVRAVTDCLVSSDGKTLTKHFIYQTYMDPQDIEPVPFVEEKRIVTPVRITESGVESVVLKYDIVLSGVDGNLVKLAQRSYTIKYAEILGREKPTRVQEFSFSVDQLPFVATIGKLQLQITAVEGDSVKYRVLVPFESNRDWNPQ